MPCDRRPPAPPADFRDLASNPRLDPAQEHALACAVTAARRSYWEEVLLPEPAGLVDALAAVLRHCADEAAVELAAELRASLVRRSTGPGGTPPRGTTRVREALLDGLVHCDPDAPCMAAIAAIARRHDPSWHARLETARRTYLRQRDRFVRANLRLVITFAKRQGGEHHTLADRIQDGNLGLLRAIERFDPTRGVRFSSYAGWWIRHAIMRSLTHHGRMVRVPSHLCLLHARAQRVRRRLASELGREPSPVELAHAIDTDPQTLTRAEVAMAARTISLDAPVLRGDEIVADTIADERVPDAADELAWAHDHRLAALAFRRLSDKDRHILLQRFPPDDEAPRTLEEVGRHWGVSRERIRQLQNRALATIRRAIEDDRGPRATSSSSTRVCA